MIPGATGIRQGLSGGQTVPKLPSIQLAIGMESANPARYSIPSRRTRLLVEVDIFLSMIRHQA